MRADLLTGTTPEIGEALAAVDAFDAAFTAGLLRPQPAQAAGLAHLAQAAGGTPLASRVAEAAEKAAAGVADEDHFVALAAARTALLGAVHDALLAQVADATSRPLVDQEPDAVVPAEQLNLLAAARSWLSDLAREGWQGLSADVVSGSAQVISAMLPEPSLRRLATLLDGFAAELAASSERIPARRWADLWSRGILLTLPGALGAPAATPATGRLLPLGIDLQEHATAAQAQVHAVFEPADGTPARLVRASVSAPKPDTVIGAGVWQLLRPRMSLLAAVTEGRSMDIADMPLTRDGDLIWSDEHARPGEPADAFATARIALPAAPVHPLDRHPARIAVPVFLDGYGVAAGQDPLAFSVAGTPLRVAASRVPAASPLTPQAVAASTACIGLLRWDAGAFCLQPLAVETTVKKKTVAVHAGAWAGGTADKDGVKAEKAATDAMNVLRERAGRLLRK